MTLQSHHWLAFALLLAVAPACDDKGSTNADSDSLVQHDGADSTGGADSTTTSDLTQSDTALDIDTTDLRNDDGTLPQLSDPFLYGINLGHPNAAWGDGETASLAAAAGCNSLRPKLPEYHLQRWGYEIEVGDMQRYASDGLHQNIAFLIGASREHSTIPVAEPDWKLDYYIPANLYEPIWLSEGVVNPDNYWAAYLFQTMTIYKDWVQYWEIWNEPDWVSDWRLSQEWATRAPTAADLPRFNGSIFDYVRMLRIAWEVKQVAAPETWIAVGGLGYPNFLDALVRYTDNPADGAVSDVFPQTGAAYFEVLSFHHYPHLSSTGNSDAAAQGVLDHKADFQTVLEHRSVSAKRWIITESGAAGTLIAGTPSGPEYARNYLWKAMALAQADGIDGIHWFILSQSLADPNNAFDHMGLYQDLAAVSTRRCGRQRHGHRLPNLGVTVARRPRRPRCHPHAEQCEWRTWRGFRPRRRPPSLDALGRGER